MTISDFASQVPFGTDSFADNPEPRCPCLLLLDTSGSMSGAPIAELNAGIQAFKDELIADEIAIKRVEVAVVTFGPVKIENEFPLIFVAPATLAYRRSEKCATSLQTMPTLTDLPNAGRTAGACGLASWS